MIGRRLAGRYELGEQMSAGAIFTLHAARDALTGRSLSIRLFRPPFDRDPRFRREVEACQRELDFESETLERLIALEEFEGEPFLVGELSQGSLLSDRIRVFAPFSVPLALGIVSGAAEGLRTLHAAGIIHGDLGPHNVVATHGGGAKLQLAGFWRAYAGDRATAQAALDQMIPYLAPELVEGSDPHERSDFYALGVLLFELLTKRTPFSGETALATGARHVSAPIPSARGLNPSVPPAVDALLSRLLAKRPEERPADADALLDDLRRLQDQLRFGKTSRSAQKPATNPNGNPVAPKMSAARNESDDRPRRPERDAPNFLIWIFVILVGTLLGLVAAWVIMSFQRPREVETPDVRGLSVSEGTALADRLRLRLRVAQNLVSKTVPAGKIIASLPGAREKIREGGTLSVTVSLGKELVTVPNLKRMTVDEARQVLGALNLDLDGTPIRQFDDAAPAGAILRQDPPSGRQVIRFTRVRVWIASPADAPPGSLPGEKPTTPAGTMYELKFRLTDASSAVEVRVDLVDAQGTRTIFRERREPDDEIVRREVGYGSDVEFRIYYDGEFRRSVKPAAPPAEGGNAGA